MKSSRRKFLSSSLSLTAAAIAPEIIIAKPKTGYTHAEIDERARAGRGLNGLTKAALTRFDQPAEAQRCETACKAA